MAFSPDGTRLIAGRNVYNLSNNSLAYSFPTGRHPAFFSQNQQFIYGSVASSGSCDGSFSIVEFNGSNYSQIRSVGTGYPHSISPNGALIINSYPGDVIRVSDGGVVASVGASGPNPYHNYKFSPNGQYVAIGRSYARHIGVDPLIVIRRTSDWSVVRSYAPDNITGSSDGGNVSVSFSPDSQMLAASNWTMRLWNVNDGTLVREITTMFAGGVSSLAFSSDGQILATTNNSSSGYPQSQYLNLWNVANGDRLNINFAESFGSSFSKIAFADNNQKLVTWEGYFNTSNTSIKVWNAANGTVLRRADSFNYAGFTPAPGGQTMAVALGGQIRIENISSGAEVRTFGGGSQRGDYPLVYSPDGQFIAASSTSFGSPAGIRLWRVSDGTELRTLANSNCCLSRINGGSAFSPDGQLFAIATEATNNFPRSGEIKLWRVSDGVLLRTMTGFENWAGSLTFTSDRQYIIATGWDATVRIYRVSDGVLLNTYTTETGFQPGSNYTLGQIALSPDGSRFAYARADSTVVMARNPYATTPPTTFTISGNITRGGSALSGAAVALSGSSSGSATTDSNGNYSFTVNEGGSYTVTPQLSGNNFTPTSQTFNFIAANQTANFTAALITYTISGNVKADGANLSGATVNLSGGQTASAQTGADGNYSFTVPAGANYTVSVYRGGINFNPASQIFNNLQGNQTANFQNGTLLCAPQSANLVAWYKGEGDTIDSSGSGNNGGFFNGTFSAGKVGQAMNFNGTNNYVSIADSPSNSITGQITVAAWIKPTTITGFQVILSKYGDGANARSFIFSFSSSGKLYFEVDQTNAIGRSYITNNVVTTAGVYQHVAATFNPATQLMEIFVNGVSVPVTLNDANTVTSIQDSPSTVRIGDLVNNAGQDSSFFNGQIDEAQMFNRALSASEIAGIANAGSAGVCTAAQLPAANGKIVFDSDRSGLRQIHTMNADGSNLTQLTNTTSPAFLPEYSFDGSKIVFARYVVSTGAYDIFTMNADGSNQVNVTNDVHFDGQPSFSPDGGRIVYHSVQNGNTDIFIMNSNGTNRIKMTSGAGANRVPSWSPDGSKIAFTSSRNGNYEVFVMNTDGSNQTRLTTSGSHEHAAFSPDSSKIVFYTDTDGNYEIYTMNIDGSNQTRLTNNPAIDYAPHYSPDGSKITFASQRDGNEEIYTMNADGTNQTRTTTNAATDTEPSWQPVRFSTFTNTNGNGKIAFGSLRTGNYEIFTMNADGSNQTNVSNNTAGDDQPAWSPDGSKIAFYSSRNSNTDIYSMNADGSNQVRLTTDTSGNFTPSWSPDGTKIVFYSNRTGNGDIYLMNADGTNQTRLTTHTAFDYAPKFSPDGSRIVFGSFRDGNREIYVMNADGSTQTRLTNNSATDEFPAFSPDGSKIAFFSYRTGNGDIYVMNADGSNPVNLSNNGAFDGFPAWSPDGTKIAFDTERDGFNREFIR